MTMIGNTKVCLNKNYNTGVLGTTEILFQSQRRGLKLSERLGFGFSCNGNNVAYVAGSPASLNAYGLNKKQFWNVPFQDRPGPAITSSHSSLGFTIQSGVLPTAYPYLIFKGIATYGWPNGHWFLHGVIDKLKFFMGLKNCQAMVLNVMGYDESDGRITLDEKSDKMCFVPSNDPLLPRKIGAFQKLTKRLGGILFMSRYRSTSVQLLGGCNSGSNPSLGVCNSNGQVFSHEDVHEGLYICDASVIPCSVGINPSLTIATVAEHISQCLVKDIMRYVLEGKKVMNPYLLASYAWWETRTLHANLRTVTRKDEEEIGSGDSKGEMINLRGELQLSLIELLRSIVTMKGNGKFKFVGFLLQSFLRTYILQTPRCDTHNPLDLIERAYPSSTLHEVRTEDGCVISCRQWMVAQSRCNPVLLLNGHSTESFYLPTEPRDLIRTLLDEGYETWLLQPRLHPLHPSNDFTIEDIGKFDIPAVIAKISEFHGPSVKVHVIAHCIGGLAIHIALMGGHISATSIKSLSCTNSSMFFKLTTSSIIKMRLPLIPISMIILGKNKILPILENSKDNLQQRILKSIARLIPRYERCTCDECEVFSGIFGNAFWHENVSPSMHWWQNKQYLPRLPLSGFPHLRKICIAGFIVDSNGENSYLVHPERMALPTLYISGGRSLLVTPDTSHLANKYMRLHQPSFLHKRVVVEGFGHSDLLMGEESYKKVDPVRTRASESAIVVSRSA
ncbi:Long-chain-alcohol oxidase FAO1 [Acorus calamus]|uniref:Cholesterol oxidase n=1 Tax=Acorus calamus TaxID=4465 RepID=A0AAV9CGN0_ACOCL|nr:Long-chain-alcohol oxidase FAO1 [Acorus calamus]